MAKVICKFPRDSSFFDDLRCPYCRENQLIWEYSRKGHVLYGRDGLPHDCKTLDLILKKEKYNDSTKEKEQK